MDKELEVYGLHLEESKDPDKCIIDFAIKDDNGKIWATVWGNNPFHDVNIECDHPAVEFDDDEHVGECPICGAWATWHWETSADDGYEIQEQVVDTWELQDEIGGIVGKYIKILKGENANGKRTV